VTGETIPRRRRGGRIALIVLGSLVALLVIVVVGGVLAAERVANSKLKEELAKLSQQLGRPVSAGPLEVHVFTGGRVAISNLVIGRDPKLPDEPDPALKLDRAYVNVALLPVIFSGGKRVTVQDVAVEGLAVQVVKRADGTLNWQDIADRLPRGEQPPPEPKPVDEATRQKARGFTLERLRVNDARVRFVDLQKGGAAAEVADLDVALDNVSLARAFDARIAAAVLAAKQNFVVQAHLGAAPDVPGEIAPPPLERVTAKLEPTALAPLAPFLASVVTATPGSGLEELTDGKVSLDLEAAPGAAAPGGKGPTTVRAQFALAGAKFAGGQPFEARLDSDLAADVAAGSLDIKRFVATIGDMALEAKGKLADLTGAGAQPRVEGFTLQSRGLDFTRLQAFYPPMDRSAGATLRGPFAITASGHSTGAGADAGARLVASVDLTPASIEVPGQFRKAAGTRLALELEATARPNLLRAERLALTMADWTIRASGSLRTQGTGKAARQSFEGTVEAPVMPVRELVALVAPKSLPDVPDVRVGARATARGTVGSPRSMKVEVPSFTVTGGRSDLAGKLALENLEAPRVSFEGRSRYLDADDFLPPSSKAAKGGAPAGKSAGKNAGKDAGKATGKPGDEVVAQKKAKAAPPPMLTAMSGTAKLTVERGRAAEIDYRNLRADLAVKGGRLAARALEVDALGGHFSGAGSEFALADDTAPVTAKGEIKDLDVAQALARFADKRNLLTGRLSANVDVTGQGTLPELLKQTLTGKLSGRLADAQFLGASLLEPVARALGEAADKVPGGRLRGLTDKVMAVAAKDRRIGTLGGALRFDGGAAELIKPLEGQTPHGAISISGKVGLDGAADMLAKLKLEPATVALLTGNKVTVSQPIPVDLAITGPLEHPRVRPADAAGLARVLVAELSRTAAGQVVKEKAQAVLDKAGAGEARDKAAAAEADAKQKAEAARVEAEAKAAEARERAQQEATDQAQKAKEAAGRKIRGIIGR
jgi:hypothetical protein